MRKSLLFVWFIIASLFFAACGPEEPSEQENTQYKENINMQSSSIEEGSEVNALLVESLVITYKAVIRLEDNPSVFLNGEAITPKMLDGSNTAIYIPLHLEEGMNYKLIVPLGTIRGASDTTRTAPEWVLNFSTKARVDGVSDIDPTTVYKILGFGWNLGNHFDTSSGQDGVVHNWWDNATPTEMLYTNLQKMGVGTVRIPVTWGNHQDVNNNYLIESDYLDLVEQNVQWAINAGLYVIINLHHDEYWQDPVSAANNPTINENVKDRIYATWTQVANRFVDYNEHLIFESLNEIHDPSWGWQVNRTKMNALVNEWNQVCVDAIRATGGNNSNRWIGCPGFCANVDWTIEGFELPNDPAKRILVALHVYDPYEFCTTRKYSEWGHTADASKAAPGSSEADIVNLFKKVYDNFIAQGIPCYFGEFGAAMQPTERGELFRNYYSEYFCRAAYLQGLSVMVWDNDCATQTGETFYFINHNDGTFRNETLTRLMIKAATSTDPTYTLESIYQRAPK